MSTLFCRRTGLFSLPSKAVPQALCVCTHYSVDSRHFSPSHGVRSGYDRQETVETVTSFSVLYEVCGSVSGVCLAC